MALLKLKVMLSTVSISVSSPSDEPVNSVSGGISISTLSFVILTGLPNMSPAEIETFVVSPGKITADGTTAYVSFAAS